jgi:hypothetical protein
MNDLKEILLNNNYPLDIIDHEFDKFNKYKQLNVDKQINPNEKIKYLSLPYINDKSEIIGRKIQNLVKDYFINIKLRVAFKAPATISSHFPFKDYIDDPKKRSGVVYHLKCKTCNEDYIGKTIRICNTRLIEHEITQKSSHVHQHHIQPGHEIDFDNVIILDRADNDLKLTYKEMLYIRKFKPTLNKQEDLYTLIIRNVQQDNSTTRDIQKYLNKKTSKSNN